MGLPNLLDCMEINTARELSRLARNIAEKWGVK